LGQRTLSIKFTGKNRERHIRGRGCPERIGKIDTALAKELDVSQRPRGFVSWGGAGRRGDKNNNKKGVCSAELSRKHKSQLDFRGHHKMTVKGRVRLGG